MTVTEKLLIEVSKGKRFSIDFKNRNMKIGNKYLVKNGKYEGEYGFTIHEALPHIEELFANYKVSLPSEHSDLRKFYFRAKSVDELSDEEMVLGEEREIARAKLESYILGLMLSGFNWDAQDELKGKWFWQGTDKSLVLFKEWFVVNEQ